MNRPDLRLYLVLGAADCRGRDVCEVAAAAVAGGATVVQLREKGLEAAEYADRARALLEVLRPRGVPLIVNDRPDVARAAGADGVHLGRDDPHWSRARDELGPAALLGLTVKTLAEARQARLAGADYVGLGPIAASRTKPDAGPRLDEARFRALAAAARRPAVAIGGVDQALARQAVAWGAAGVAVVGAVCAADDPCAAARELRRAVDEGLAQGQR